MLETHQGMDFRTKRLGWGGASLNTPWCFWEGSSLKYDRQQTYHEKPWPHGWKDGSKWTGEKFLAPSAKSVSEKIRKWDSEVIVQSTKNVQPRSRTWKHTDEPLKILRFYLYKHHFAILVLFHSWHHHMVSPTSKTAGWPAMLTTAYFVARRSCQGSILLPLKLSPSIRKWIYF